ncbi:Sulfotransferase [Hordeum vulgare]|nr:Sulfotransferase [Hordeum vulgare]
MKDAAEDPSPPSSSAPPSSVHCTMTSGEACAHYMDMVWDDREELFRVVQDDAAYNLKLLEEHRRAKEQLDARRAIALGVDVMEQAMMLESFHSVREISLARWQYHQ